MAIRTSGTYAGNNASTQTVAVGISALVVLVTEVTDGSNGCSAVLTTGRTVNSIRSSGVGSVLTDNTVGISGTNLVAGLACGTNTSGKTYTWIALG
jgi:hypothetical protein